MGQLAPSFRANLTSSSLQLWANQGAWPGAAGEPDVQLMGREYAAQGTN
jgi:hypothetical protein